MPSSKKKNRAKKKKEKAAAATAMKGGVDTDAAEAAHDAEVATTAPASSSENCSDDGNSGAGAVGDGGDGATEAGSGGCVELGFAQKLTAEELEQPALHDDPDWRNWDGGKIGGQPSWLSPLLPPPSKLICSNCGGRESLMAQVYAPVDCDDGRAFHGSGINNGRKPLFDAYPAHVECWRCH